MPSPARSPTLGTARVRRRTAGARPAPPPGAPRGQWRQLQDLGAYGTPRPCSGCQHRQCAGGETRSAREEPRWSFVAVAKFAPRLGFRWAWTAACGGLLARSELRAYRPPPPPPGASLLLGARGAVRAPERRQAARAPARAPPPAASPPGLPKSPPVGASVACASAGATYPGQRLLLVQRALGLQR